MIIAAEMSAPLRLTSGPAITHAGDLAAILSGLNEGDVLFVDEIHRMSRPAEEMLYMAMEDFRVDVVIGKGPGATAIPLEIPPFTLVGATTRAGLLPGPLRDRFGFTAPPGVLRGRRARPDRAPLRRAARRRADRRGRGRDRLPLPRHARGSPTGCCAGSATTPRCAPTASSPSTVAQAALDLYEVDELGLDRLDRAVLDALCRRFGGGPVGVSTLAVAVGEERETVEEVAEPFLVRSGFLARTPRGRVATPAAWEHLGLGAARRRRRVARDADPVRGRESGSSAGRRTAMWPAQHPRLHLPVGSPRLRAAARPVVPHSTLERLFRGGHRTLLPIVGIALIFWLLIIRPAQRRQKETRAACSRRCRVGDEVVLTSGIFGTVSDDRRRPLARSRSPPGVDRQGRPRRGRHRGPPPTTRRAERRRADRRPDTGRPTPTPRSADVAARRPAPGAP